MHADGENIMFAMKLHKYWKQVKSLRKTNTYRYPGCKDVDILVIIVGDKHFYTHLQFSTQSPGKYVAVSLFPMSI